MGSVVGTSWVVGSGRGTVVGTVVWSGVGTVVTGLVVGTLVAGGDVGGGEVTGTTEGELDVWTGVSVGTLVSTVGCADVGADVTGWTGERVVTGASVVPGTIGVQLTPG